MIVHRYDGSFILISKFDPWLIKEFVSWDYNKIKSLNQ